ncbi:MAG: DUF1289 domain-containing protein [Planctomycetes bacterium]|nr:DUF1289 domain-containing protein [Planctomycetota bacterium]MCB9887598.1 DUF1289 domain-containing protein [Planctomycetota bacterium]
MQVSAPGDRAPRVSQPPPVSPCVRVCRIDDRSGWCTGCRRTLGEIAAWPRLDDAARHAVLAALPARVTCPG